MTPDIELKAALIAGQPVVVDGVLYNMDAAVAAWTNEQLGGGIVPTLARAFGVLQEGISDIPTVAEIPSKLIAGAYYFNHYDPADGGVSDITVAVAVNDIAASRPEVFRAILMFPFGQLKCRRISAEIDLSNDRAVRQAQKLGFMLEGRKRKAGKLGGDVGMFGLLPEECQFWRTN